MRDWTTGQRAALARVILTKWWQDKDPPIGRHHMGNDLNICKRLIEREGENPDRLAQILDLYDGPPATLRVFYATGNRNLLSELRGKWHREQEREAARRDMGNMSPMKSILRGLYDGNTGDAA